MKPCAEHRYCRKCRPDIIPTLSAAAKKRWQVPGYREAVIRGVTGSRGNGTYIDNRGYVRIKTAGGWNREHRAVVEQSLGEKLEPYEVVHHKDGDKTNNELANLEVMTVRQHQIHHRQGGHQ